MYRVLIFTLFLVVQTIGASEPLGNRFFVKNFLMTKFGSHHETFLIENVIKNISVFNGPCDIYGQVVIEKDNELREVYPEATCYSDISQSKIDMNGKKSTLRKAWLLKTCLYISKDNKSIEKVREEGSIKFVKDFFSYEDDTKSFLKNVDIEKLKPNELILKLCTAPQWQRI